MKTGTGSAICSIYATAQRLFVAVPVPLFITPDLHWQAEMTMTCHDLAARIEQLQPGAAPREVARLCLLLANHVQDLEDLGKGERLSQAWQEMGIRLQAATDQHAAMTEDLEKLARTDSGKFTLDQVWVLIRAIRVQSQILELYVGQPPVTA